MQEDNDQVPQTILAGRRHRWLVRLFWSLSVVVLLFAAMGAALLWTVGRDFTAPEWLRAEVVARLNKNDVGLVVSVDQIVAQIEDGWHPRVRLQNVDVAQPDGQPLISFADMDIAVSMPELFRGRVEPAGINVSGVSLRLRRLEDGRFDLAIGETFTPVGNGVTFAQVISGLDHALMQRGLSSLEAVEINALTLRYEDLRLQRGWTVDGGRLRLTRDGDALEIRADLALLGGSDTVSTLEMNFSSEIGQNEASVGVNFSDFPTGDIAMQSPALVWLNVLRAPISGAMRAQMVDDGTMGKLSATLHVGQGVLQPTEATKPISFDDLRAYMTYDPEAQSLMFDDLTVASKWGALKATGVANIIEMKNGLPTEFISQLMLSEIEVNPAAVFEAPVQFDNASADLRLRLDPFELRLGQLIVSDSGQIAQVSGRLQAEPAGWSYALQGQRDALTRERLIALWPQKMAAPTRKWVVENLHAAQFHDLEFAWRGAPDITPDLFLGFGFDEAEFTFLKHFPPMTGVSGQASIDGFEFVAQARTGQVAAPQGGNVDVADTAFYVDDIRVKKGPARVNLQMDGTITAALSLLDLEPFRFIQKSGRQVTLADGRARIGADFAFRLKKGLKPDEVRYSANATLSNVRSEKLVPGRILAASVLDLVADNKRLRISGKGQLDGLAFDGAWESPIGKGTAGTSKIAGSVELSQEFADVFNIGLPRGSLDGATPAQFEIDLAKGQTAKFRLESNLQGMKLAVPQLSWSKPSGTNGALLVKGTLGSPPSIDRLRLEAPGLRVTGDLAIGRDGGLRIARFDRVRVGNWLDAPVLLEGRGKGRPPAIKVVGGTIDLRNLSGASAGSGAAAQRQATPISLSVDALQISDSIRLADFRGDFTSQSGLNGQFKGRVNGKAPVSGVVVPRDGRSAFRIRSDDAGRVFAAAELLESTSQGTLDLTLLPGNGSGVYDGFLAVKDIWLRDAPAMAELLNAISVVGVLDQLSGSGILFNEVDARFRLTPNRVIVSQASATGASMGISMDGYFDIGSKQMDMQGVLSPIYMLNGIGAGLTRKGEGLLGFNYRLRGTAENPNVQVNPLSIFTPGMFRDLFRRPAPKVSQ